jgi:hypothetical protein
LLKGSTKRGEVSEGLYKEQRLLKDYEKGERLLKALGRGKSADGHTKEERLLKVILRGRLYEEGRGCRRVIRRWERLLKDYTWRRGGLNIKGRGC